MKDFSPVSLIALTPFALVTNPSFPAANAKEFIALLRANPDEHAFSSSGTGATARTSPSSSSTRWRGSRRAMCPTREARPRSRT